tara:strand:- start:1180 stop:1755 length:576 start_codon:yes stop_codon:yes gene_type:complete
MLLEAKTISGIVSQSSGVISQVISGIDKYQNIKADEDAYLRLLYLEVLHNLEILETINISKLTKVPVGDAGFKLLIDQLSIEVMAGVFAPQGKKSERIYKFLNENGTIRYTTKASVIEGQEVVKGKQVETSVLKSLVYLVTKIEALKKVAFLGEQEYVRQLRLTTRVSNIKERLVFLRKKFIEYKPLQGLS